MKESIKPHKGLNKLSSPIITLALILTFLSTSPSIAAIKGMVQEKMDPKQLRLYIAIPVLFISLAELLFFSDRTAAAACLHIGILIALSLSSIFIKNSGINNLYMSLMLLPLLRLINLSVPIFLDVTLYTFVFTYIPLAVAAEAIIIYQRIPFREIGLTTKNLPIYMVLSVPLGFLLGLGEFLTIKVGYLIPDVTFVNLLELFSIMVLFVSLVEELVFRSILQTRFEKLLDAREALIVTSLLFGIMHSGYGTFYEIFYTAFAGFVIGFAFYKTRSLPFVVLIHGFANVFLFGVLSHDVIGWAWL